MSTDPDDVFESIFMWTLPFWGPFYGIYYIIRFIWKETHSKRP